MATQTITDKKRIKAVQKLINRFLGHKRVDENGEYDKKTVDAIKYCQQKFFVTGPKDGVLTEALIKKLKQMEKLVLSMYARVPYKNKYYYLTKKEYDQLRKEALTRCNHVWGTYKMAADRAKQTYIGVTKQPYLIRVVGGVKTSLLPDKTRIQHAIGMCDQMKTAVKDGDLRKFQLAAENAEPVIIEVAKAVNAVAAKLDRRISIAIPALQITSAVGFAIVGGIAAAELAAAGAMSTWAAEITSSAGTTGLGTLSNELGKWTAGTSKGGKDAAKNVVVDTLLSAGLGSLTKSSKYESMFEGAAKLLPSKLKPETAKKITEICFKNVVDGSVGDLGKMFKDKIVSGKEIKEEDLKNMVTQQIVKSVLFSWMGDLVSKKPESQAKFVLKDALPLIKKHCKNQKNVSKDEALRALVDFFKEGGGQATDAILAKMAEKSKGKENKATLQKMFVAEMLKGKNKALLEAKLSGKK